MFKSKQNIRKICFAIDIIQSFLIMLPSLAFFFGQGLEALINLLKYAIFCFLVVGVLQIIKGYLRWIQEELQ